MRMLATQEKPHTPNSKKLLLMNSSTSAGRSPVIHWGSVIPWGGSLSAYFVLEFINEIYFNKFTISIRSYIFSRICQKIQFTPCSQWKPNQNIPALAVSGIKWLCHISLCRSVLSEPTSYRPRLLLEGRPGSGHSSHLAPAVLHALEKFTVYTLDLALLFGSSATAPEETCAQVTDPS